MRKVTEVESAVGVNEIAELLAVHPETVRRYAKTGEIPSFKVGNRFRFFPSEVREHLTRPRDPWAVAGNTVAAQIGREMDPWAQPRRARKRNRWG